MRCKIGNVAFKFSEDGKIARHICEEFGLHKGHADFEIALHIKPEKNLANIKGDFKKNERGRFFDTGYVASYPRDFKMMISLDDGIQKGGLLESVAKIKDWNYLTPSEIVAKNLIYDLLEPLSHELTAGKGNGFIHASAYSMGDSCALVTGEGGVGKTTLCLIAQKRGYDYLNDDLSVVDAEGFCHHHPKRLQIYGYNIKEFSDLKERIFIGRSYLDLIQFDFRNLFLGPKKVRRRVSSGVLFGKVPKRAKVKRIFFLTRGRELRIMDMDEDQFIESETRIIENEFSDYLGGLKNVDSQKHQDLLVNTRKMYKKLFECSECQKVTVPVPCDMEELFSHLEKEHPLSVN